MGVLVNGELQSVSFRENGQATYYSAEVVETIIGAKGQIIDRKIERLSLSKPAYQELKPLEGVEIVARVEVSAYNSQPRLTYIALAENILEPA